MRALILFFALAAAALFSPCRQAQAELTDFACFSIDLPADWTFDTEGDTVILVAKDASCAVTVTAAPQGGMTLEELAGVFAKEFQGDPPTRTAEGFTFFFPNANGLVSRARIREENNMYILTVSTGEHPALEVMLASIRPH